MMWPAMWSESYAWEWLAGGEHDVIRHVESALIGRMPTFQMRLCIQ